MLDAIDRAELDGESLALGEDIKSLLLTMPVSPSVPIIAEPRNAQASDSTSSEDEKRSSRKLALAEAERAPDGT